MRKPLILGIDAGLTMAKAALFDDAYREVAAAGVGNKVLRPVPGSAERSMDEAWANATTAIRKWLAAASASGADVAAVGVTGAPCRQLVPKSRERVQALVVLRGNAEFRRQTFEQLAVQHVEIGPRPLAPANAIEGGRIIHPPRINKRRPIGPNAARVSPRRQMRDHTASPIDERAKCIEDQGANSVHGSRPFPIGPLWAEMRCSRAAP